MWQQQQQQQHQQAYLRGLPPQLPQQQTHHLGIIGTDNHAPHQPHQQHHHQHHRATIMDLPVPRSVSLSYCEIKSPCVSRRTDMRIGTASSRAQAYRELQPSIKAAKRSLPYGETTPSRGFYSFDNIT